MGKKNNKNTLLDDFLMCGGSPAIFGAKKLYDVAKDILSSDNEMEGNEKDDSDDKFRSWQEFVDDLLNYRTSDRSALMFLPDNSAYEIWSTKFPGDSGIVYVPSSLMNTLEGITIEGQPTEGVLYVLDPRDDSIYYLADDIYMVLLKDHLLEMKSVFERLGATSLDISFVEEDDDKNGKRHSDGQSLKGNYQGHSAGISHEHTSSSKRHSSQYYQLEIHKKLKGIQTDLDRDNLYWLHKDDVFGSEVDSIIDGLTKEVHFREVAKSYISQTSANLHKIEAEYSFMKMMGVSGSVNWSNESLSSLSKSTIWDVHVIISENPQTVHKPIHPSMQIEKDDDDVVYEENGMAHSRANFHMVIEGVFQITGRGTVITGRIDSGVIHTGDTIYIENSDTAIRTIVTGVEVFKKILDRGKFGDNVGLWVQGVSKEEIQRGDIALSAQLRSKPIRQHVEPELEDDEEEDDDSEYQESETEYIETLKEILDDGKISERERRLLEKLRVKLGISEERATELESTLSGTSLTEEEQEYLASYREMLDEGGEISFRERKLLDKIAKLNDISPARAKELESMA